MARVHYEVVRDKNIRGRMIHATRTEAIECAKNEIAKGRARCCKVYRSAPGAFEQVAEFTAQKGSEMMQHDTQPCKKCIHCTARHMKDGLNTTGAYVCLVLGSLIPDYYVDIIPMCAKLYYDAKHDHGC